MLECQHLTKTFQGVTLLDNVNWQWPATGRFATSAVGGERPGVQVVVQRLCSATHTRLSTCGA